MPLQLSNYRYGSPRDSSNALRIGTTRFVPRGVAKADYAKLSYFDLWFPLLAPSRELLSWYRDTNRSVEDFYRRYRKEMARTDSTQAIRLLAEIAQRTPISVGCYCADETRCHRAALELLIRADSR